MSVSPPAPASAGVDAARQPAKSAGAAAGPACLPPAWFECLVVVGTVGVLAFGGFGELLALAGHYSLGAALALGAVGAICGAYLAWPNAAERAAAGRRVKLPAAVMCAVAAGIAAWNAVYIGHHVAVDQDPGIYAVSGRWIAEHGNLVVPGGTPWAPKGAGLFDWASAGMYPQPNGMLEFQFAHFLPSLLAEGQGIGGDALMFRIPSLLGAIALCCVYAAGCRLINRPWLVLGAVTALGVSLPELSVTRETFSEPATQVLLWGGIVLLLRAYERRSVRLSLMAGLAIGGTVMSRIDAIAYLVPLPVLAGVAWLAASSRADRRKLLQMIAAFVIGVVPPTVLGTLDVQRRAGYYYRDLHGQVMTLYKGTAASVVIAVVLVALWPRLPRVRAWLAARRAGAAALAAWVVAIGLALAWSLRPAGPKAMRGVAQTTVEALQRTEGLPIQPARSYDEQSMVWLSWYLGPICLGLAIAGLCVLIVRAIARGSAPALVVLALTAVITTVYVWNPSITPEQIWAMRRYVPASLPLLVLAAAVAVDAAASLSGRLWKERAWPRGVVVAGVAGIVAFPLGASLPVRHFQPQAGYLPLVKRTCQVIGPDAAVLFPAKSYEGATLTQTLRSWCGVAATRAASPTTRIDVPALAASFRAEGRTLWILASTAQSITQLDASLKPTLVGTATSTRELAQTLSRPPTFYSTIRLTIFAAKVS